MENARFLFLGNEWPKREVKPLKYQSTKVDTPITDEYILDVWPLVECNKFILKYLVDEQILHDKYHK